MLLREITSVEDAAMWLDVSLGCVRVLIQDGRPLTRTFANRRQSQWGGRSRAGDLLPGRSDRADSPPVVADVTV